jgi:hypothetical protein
MVRKFRHVAFPYALVLLTVIILVAGFGMMAGLHWWQILIWAVSACLVIGAIMFTFFEVRRLAGVSRSDAEIAREEAEAERQTRHVVIVQPPTGEAQPHHEDHAESPGLDQGQLTSRTPGGTPLIEDLLRKRKQEQDTRS